ISEYASYDRTYWSRVNPETQTVYTVEGPDLNNRVTLPFPPYPLRVEFSIHGLGGNFYAQAVAKIKFVDPTLGQSERPLMVGPPVSVLLTSPGVVAPVGGAARAEIGVTVRSNAQNAVHGKLRLETPPGWKVEPAEIAVELDHDGDLNNYNFQVTPQNLHEGTYKVTA